MPANLLAVFSWASTWALNASEPVVLLVLGGLFLVLSFLRVRSNRERQAAPSQPAQAQSIPGARTPLAAHQGR
jgi:hypothetical protein